MKIQSIEHPAKSMKILRVEGLWEEQIDEIVEDGFAKPQP